MLKKLIRNPKGNPKIEQSKNQNQRHEQRNKKKSKYKPESKPAGTGRQNKKIHRQNSELVDNGGRGKNVINRLS